MYEHTNIRYVMLGLWCIYLCCFTRSWPEDPGCGHFVVN